MNPQEKLSKVESQLAELLEEKPALIKLEKQREAVWQYWKKFDGLVWGISKEMWIFGRVTNPDYISRALRKLRVKKKEYDDPQRYTKEKEFLNNYKK